MKTIYIVRHGETNFNKENKVQGVTDNPLNSTGILQARENAKYLKEINPELIVSSPLIRAVETAQIFKEDNNWDSEIIIDNDVRERNFGDAEALNANEFRKLDVTKDVIGYETDEEVLKRVEKAIKHYINLNNDNTVIFAHGHVVKAGLILYGLDKEFLEFLLPNCSILKIDFDDEKIYDSHLINCEIELI